MKCLVIVVLWATAALALDPGDDDERLQDLRQFNQGYDPSFNTKTAHKQMSYVKTSKTASSTCSTPPQPPPNSELKCSTYSGCVLRCLRNHQFPNGKSQAALQCLEDRWVVPSEPSWDPVPACQPVCLPECQNGGFCMAPNQCQCKSGFSGPQCQFEEKPCLSHPVLPKNSKMKCSQGGCTVECLTGYRFPDNVTVATLLCEAGVWVPRNSQWQTVPDCEAICEPECQNGGTCVAHNLCQCPENFRGHQCQYSIQRCSVRAKGFNGSFKCKFDIEQVNCNLTCPRGSTSSAPLAASYTCRYDQARFEPHPMPKCNFGFGVPIKRTVTHSYGTRKSAPSAGTCTFWAGAHLQTFDGLVSSFSSDCSYTLLKDTTGALTVNMARDPARCAQFRNCGMTLKIYIEDSSFTLSTNDKGKVVLTQNSNHTFPVPVRLSDLSVNQVGSITILTMPAFGVTIKWDTKTMLQLEASEHLWNRTVGLCGRMDGNSGNDFECRDEKQVDSLPVFLSSWEADFLSNHCTAAAEMDHPCSKSDLDADATKFCSKLLDDPTFKACHGVLDQNKYFEACRWDFCTHKSSEAACETVAMFANECRRKKVALDAFWRTEDFCAMNCTGGSIYQACGPATEPSCLSSAESQQTVEFCVEGCYCPLGTVRHHGNCIPREQCPCQFKGRLFSNGESVNAKCNTCVCQGGAWKCTKAVCGARCSIVGDPHYTTFDGKAFDFMGKCSYQLLKADGLSVEAENVQCAGSISEAIGFQSAKNPSCTKTITVHVNGSVIKLKQHREIVVNGKEINRLPITVGGAMVRRLSSLFVAVELQSGVLVWWDGFSQAYIDVPASFYDKTQGLCGTFNNNQKDDFLTPEGDVEQDVAAFANKWKVQETCPNADSTSSDLDPCSENPEKKSEAERLCAKLKSATFSGCSLQVEVEQFYKNCLFDVCSCASDLNSCFCPVAASFAHECAANNVPLNWRQEIRECGVQCPAGQAFQACGDFCSHSCSDISLHQQCAQKCVEGCNCPPGKTLDKSGECVAIEKCPCLHAGREFAPGSFEIRSRANDTKELCKCSMGLWQCSEATPGDSRHFTESLPIISCDNSKKLEFTECEPEVPRTCKNLHEKIKKSTAICKSGCTCRAGLVLDSLSNTCVEPKKCPCHHGGRSYSDGAKIQEKCNTCDCQHGKWNCSSRVCWGTCSAWGDSHFKTFDGRLFDFQGQCSYALAQSHATPADQFQVSVQSVICGSQGATCVRSVTVSLGQGDQAESVTLSKNTKLPPLGSLKRTIVRDLGLHIVLEVFDLGLVVRWDRGTRVYVSLDPKWKNRVQGLCGNFNDNELDDFQTPSGGVVEASETIFGDSWRLQPQCLPASQSKDNCADRPSRKAWAAEKCSVLLEAFRSCHSEVPVDPYYQRCLQDTCACDLGGDCECLCTAISAYAQECNENGVPVKWRTQELCPMQCDEKCSSYSPCISTCPRETCENYIQLKGSTQLCSEEVCVEGCLLDKCPEGQIYNSMTDLKCIPIGTCKHPCKQIGNTTYYEGDIIKQDACHTCHCSKQKSVCNGVPCTTRPPSTTTTTTTPQPTTTLPTSMSHSGCESGWSKWFSSDTPDKVKKFSDRERLDRPQHIGFLCGVEHVVAIKCRTIGDHIDYHNVRSHKVTCDKKSGLICNGNSSNPCPDFEIQVKCACEPGWCKTGWTQWFNSSHPEDGSGDYELLSDIEEAGLEVCREEHITKMQCKYIDTAASVAGVKSKGNKRLKDYKESNQIGVTCKKKHGLMCENQLQVDSVCHDYAIRVWCQCENVTITVSTTVQTETTSPACPPGFEIRNCLDECEGVCHSFEATLRLEGLCSSDCTSGCVKIREKCGFGYSSRSDEECVATEDCPCLANDGTIVQPGGVHYENAGCTKCQCVGNNYKCVPVPCSTPKNQVRETTISTEESTTTELTITESTPPVSRCDFWSAWFDEHSPANDPFEREGKSPLELYEIGFCQEGHVEKISCVTKDKEVDVKNAANSNVKCDLTSGLRCYDDDQGLIGKCLDYKVRYYCSCEARTETQTTPSTTPTVIVTSTPSNTPPSKCDPKNFVPLIEGEKPLSDSAFTASSTLNSKYAAKNARIGKDNRDYTWLAGEDDDEQFLLVDLGRDQIVFAVTTQGNSLTEQFVTSYKVQYSLDGYTFSDATEYDGSPKIFRGPLDSSSLALEVLPVPFEARFVRIKPLNWNNGIALKLEVYGCSEIRRGSTSPPDHYEAVCDGEMGVGDERVHGGQISVSSVLNGDLDSHGGHLARLGKSSAWRPNHNAQTEWIMVDFTGPREVTGIATQGDESAKAWVTAYHVQYSQDGHQWNKILDDNQNEIVFLGNVDATSVVKNNFGRIKSAQYLKIIPIKWNGGIGMRLEIYGCYEPYPTMSQMEVKVSTPVPLECSLCPGLPQEKIESCQECPGGLKWNGEGCVAHGDCSCYVDHVEYPVGSAYETHDCLKCTCTLGGAAQCQTKTCPACPDPLHRSILTPQCGCLCKPCPEDSRICPSSRVCVPEVQWCDGIDHCQDDEVNCTRVTPTPSIPTCPPEPKCEDDFVLKKITKKKVSGGVKGVKMQLLRCPIYECVPPPEDHFCLVEGKTIITFDNTTLHAELCDHVLVQERGQWSVSAIKHCNGETEACDTKITIIQGNLALKLNTKLEVEVNGYVYDAQQAQTIAANSRKEYEIAKIGDAVVFHSYRFGFTLLLDDQGDAQIKIPNKLNGRVDGLCGLMNGDASDDKTKPDGNLAQSNLEFVESWKVPDSNVVCTPPKCPVETQDAAYRVCMDIKTKGKSLGACNNALPWDNFLAVCIERVCECLRDRREHDCKCAAALSYVSQCNALHLQGVDLTNWRLELSCPVDCPSGQVHYDCYRHKCEPSCATLSSPCPEDKKTCYSGCFCQEGLVRKGDHCVKPETCKDCVCDGFGDPQYLTFDRRNYTFNGNCSYIASRDISDSGAHQFEIFVTNVECVDEPGTTCTEGVTVLHQGHVVSVRRLEGKRKIVTTLDGEVIKKFPVHTNWMAMEAVPRHSVTLLLTNLQIEVKYVYNNHAFTIRLPSHSFANKTEGLCGNCNKDPLDDFMSSDGVLTNNANDFGYSWLVKNLPKGILFEENCKVNELEECMPLPPDQDPCLWIMDEDKFGKCHQVVDPLSYIRACQFDVCHSKNRQRTACRDVEAYARDCQRHGLCFDWRSDGLCPFECPAGLQYSPCGPGCSKTCENIGHKCKLEDSEGCFCPQGEVLRGDKCVPESKCVACDTEGHYPGDQWHPDKCTTCTCVGGQNVTLEVKCKEQSCNPIICQVGQIKQIVPGTENDCCPKETCIEKPKEECSLQPPPECGLHQELKNLALPYDCPEYVCQCIPKENCPPITGVKKFEFVEEGSKSQHLEPGMVLVVNETGCCLHETFECRKEKCPKPKCPQFFEIHVVQGTEDKCCPITQCLPPKDKCIFEPNFMPAAQGGERKRNDTERQPELHQVNSTWLESPCRKCMCKSDNDMPTVQCAEKTCAPQDDSEYEIKLEWTQGKCCPNHKRTSCKVDNKIYREGEKWSPENDPCTVHECIQVEGILQKTTKIIECNSTCEFGWKYEAPGAGLCCGKCVQVACVVEGVLHDIGETWKSSDKCSTFSCGKTGENVQVDVSTQVCPPTNCGEEEMQSSADGCCRICDQKSENRLSCAAEVLSEEETIALVTELNANHGKCYNAQPIKNYKECQGACDSGTRYNRYNAFSQVSDCKCCQGLKFEVIKAQVTCEDGYTFEKDLRVPSECSCRKCSGEESKNNKEEVKSTDLFSDYDAPLPAQ